MSDNWIKLIPEDPRVIPDPDCQKAALKRFQEIAPDAEEIEIKLTEKITFHDCGANFQRIICPSCNAEMSIDWWEQKMDEDYIDNGFKLDEYTVPCCGAAHTLHDLSYDWPQGMGRFSLEAMNPNIGELNEELKKELEGLLNTKIRVIYQHL